MGLRQEIANAKTETEVLKLIDKANKNYTMASEKTKRSWKSTAVRTIAALNKVVNKSNKVDEKKQSSKKKSPKKESK